MPAQQRKGGSMDKKFKVIVLTFREGTSGGIFGGDGHRYFYKAGAAFDATVEALREAGFQARDRNSTPPAFVEFLHDHNARDYYLSDADLDQTVMALRDAGFQQGDRIEDHLKARSKGEPC